MKQIFLVILVFIITTFRSFGQEIGIDFVIYSDPKKSEYRLVDIMGEISKNREGKNTCTKFTMVDSIQVAKSAYVFELWEYGELLKSGIFREKRTQKKTDNAGKETTVNIIAAGVQTKVSTKFFGRLYERETGAIVDVFHINGTIIKEIEDTDVKNKYNPDNGVNRVLEDAKLIEYEKQINTFKKDFFTGYVAKLETAINNSINPLLPAPIITKINEEKDGKVKEVSFTQCYEKTISYDWLYCDIYAEHNLLDSKRFLKVGKGYITTDGKQYKPHELTRLGIRKGEKELLPLFKNNAKMYAMENLENEYFLEEAFKDKTDNYDFIFEYDPLNIYTPAQKKYIELYFQAHMLGHKNVKVIANNQMTASLNNTFSGAFADKKNIDFDTKDVGNSKTIWLKIGNPKKQSTSLGKFSVKAASDGPSSDEVYIQASLKIKENEFKDAVTMQITPGLLENYFITSSLQLEQIDDAIYSTGGSIKGLTTIPGEKDEFVLVESDFLVSKIKAFDIYDTDNITKKTKPVGVLKKEEALSPYTALFKIDEGKKVLLPGIKSNSKYYLRAQQPSSFFGLVASRFASSFKNYRM